MSILTKVHSNSFYIHVTPSQLLGSLAETLQQHTIDIMSAGDCWSPLFPLERNCKI